MSLSSLRPVFLPHLRAAAAGCALLLLSGACSKGDGPDAWAGSVDTLASGTVMVRNPETGVWKEGEGWTLEETLRIGSAGDAGPELFGSVAAVEVDALGRIWVLERQAKELRVFGAGGAHVRTIGREGAGPGEFRDPIGLAWAPDGTLWVADPGNARYTVFDTAGAPRTTHPRPIGGYSIPWKGRVDADGRVTEVAFAQAGGEFRTAVLRFRPAGGPADTLVMPPERSEQFELSSGSGARISRTVVGVPFTPGLDVRLDPRGGVWTAFSDRTVFHLQEIGGDTVLVVERPHRPVPVTDADRAQALKDLEWFTKQGGRVDLGRLPAHKPAFTFFVADDEGNLWVRPQTPAGEGEGTPLDVYGADGRYLGRVHAAGGLDQYPPPVVRNGAIYGTASDEMDVPYVVRIAIHRGRR